MILGIINTYVLYFYWFSIDIFYTHAHIARLEERARLRAHTHTYTRPHARGEPDPIGDDMRIYEEGWYLTKNVYLLLFLPIFKNSSKIAPKPLDKQCGM